MTHGAILSFGYYRATRARNSGTAPMDSSRGIASSENSVLFVRLPEG